MKIENNTIVFRSIPSAYLKEKYGSKPNTVRQIYGTEWQQFQDSMKNLTQIRIINTDTGEFFTRKLTDMYIHFIKVVGRDDLAIWIFSWKNYELIDN